MEKGKMNEVVIRQNQMEFMKREGFALQQIAYDNKRQRGAIVIHIVDASKKIGVCPCDYMELARIKKCLPKHIIKMVQESNPVIYRSLRWN